MRIEAGIPAQAQTTLDPRVEHAARGFEQALVRQLAQTLLASARGDDEDSGAQPLYSDMLPDALSDAIEQAGGFGLAQSLAKNLSIGAHLGDPIDSVLPNTPEESAA